MPTMSRKIELALSEELEPILVSLEKKLSSVTKTNCTVTLHISVGKDTKQNVAAALAQAASETSKGLIEKTVESCWNNMQPILTKGLANLLDENKLEQSPVYAAVKDAIREYVMFHLGIEYSYGNIRLRSTAGLISQIIQSSIQKLHGETLEKEICTALDSAVTDCLNKAKFKSTISKELDNRLDSFIRGYISDVADETIQQVILNKLTGVPYDFTHKNTEKDEDSEV